MKILKHNFFSIEYVRFPWINLNEDVCINCGKLAGDIYSSLNVNLQELYPPDTYRGGFLAKQITFLANNSYCISADEKLIKDIIE